MDVDIVATITLASGRPSNVAQEAIKYDPLSIKDYELPDFDLYEVDLEDDNGD